MLMTALQIHVKTLEPALMESILTLVIAQLDTLGRTAKSISMSVHQTRAKILEPVKIASTAIHAHAHQGLKGHYAKLTSMSAFQTRACHRDRRLAMI